MLKTLLKAKADEKKSLKKLIDEFVANNRDKNYKTLDEFLKSLKLFIWQKWDNVDREVLKELVEAKLKELHLSFDVSGFDRIWEKSSAIAAVAAGAAVGVKGKFVFDRVDAKAIKAMKEMFYWSGSEYNKKTEDNLKSIIDRVFRGEIPRDKVVEVLEDELKGVLKGSKVYFEGVSDHIINQSQSVSRVIEAEKYEVRYFKIIAVLDSRTTKICRSMNDRVIPIEHLKAQADRLMSAKTMQQKKDAAVWKNDYHFGKLPKNFGLPPYHFRCRTMATAVYMSEETIEGKRVKFVDKDRDDEITMIDKMGIQRRVKKDTWDKLKSKHKLSKKETIGVLNDIKYIAQHDDFHERFVAMSGRGYVAVFEGEKVVTIFKPSSRSTEYFNKNAKSGTITDIDSGKTIQRVKKWFGIF